MQMLYFIVILIFFIGCGKRPPVESMTEGTTAIGASDAVKDLAWNMSREFQMVNPKAFVDIYRSDTQSLLDSLLNERVEEVFIDRTVSREESLAFQRQELKLLTYPVAYFPVYLLVKPDNPVVELDSVELRGILTGTITMWDSVGGTDETITPYMPLPGTGAWTSLMNFFGQLDSVVAVACSTDMRMIELSANDPGALLIYSHSIENLSGYKKLRFARSGNSIPANAKTILEAPIYPFKLDLTYVTTHDKGDVAAGYLTFLVGDAGQRLVMKYGYRPAVAPVRVIQMR